MVKNKKGITLIALVVTIVVLLILAGVTISLLLDENGIIAKSKDARNANRAGAIKEEITLWKADKFAADNGAGSHESMDDFLARLKTRGLISDEDIATIKDTKKLQVGKETIVFPSDAKTLVQAFKDNEIKVGDYLNYNDYVDETKTCTTLTNENGWADQKYTATKNTYWQVLGLDSTGEKLMLISQSPIKKEMKEAQQEVGQVNNKIRLASIENAVKLGTETSGGESSGSTGTTETWETTPYLVLKGAYGYVNCKTILNNISGIYSTSLGTAESLTIEEINRLIGGITVDYENNAVYSNADKTTSIGGTTNKTSYTYQAGDYSPKSYIEKTTETKGESISADYYDYAWANLAISDTLKTILFSGTTEDANFAKSYWLASSGVRAYSSRAGFGPGVVDSGYVNSNYGLFYSNGKWNAYGLAVRPVVYLNSEVTVEDLHVIDGQEDNWSTYNNSNPQVASGDASNGEEGNPGNSGGGPNT